MRKLFLFIAVFCLMEAEAAQEAFNKSLAVFWGLKNMEFCEYADNDTAEIRVSNREKRCLKNAERFNKIRIRQKYKIDAEFPALRWSDGKIFVRKAAENLYKPEHGGMESYQIENNKFRIFFNMAPMSGQSLIGYWKSVDGNYVYYNNNDDIVGRFNPVEGQYYAVSSNAKNIVKETIHATLLDGVLYFGQNVRYLVDNGFDPVITGFFLFY